MKSKYTIIAILLLYTFGCEHSSKSAPPKVAEAAKSTKIEKPGTGKLAPHDPFIASHNKKWEDEIEHVTSNEDFERIKEIFNLKQQVDGIFSHQYSIDLFNIYKKNPLFFVKAVYKYYPDRSYEMIDVWINEAGEVSLEDLINAAKHMKDNVLIKKFIKEVSDYEKAYWKRIRMNS